MSSWRQQAVIEAPVEQVWACVGDPRRWPEWAENVVSVFGLPTVEPDAEFQQVSQTPLGKAETTFKIEELDDLHAIKLRCQQSGYYSRWVLTEAQSSTFRRGRNRYRADRRSVPPVLRCAGKALSAASRRAGD